MQPYPEEYIDYLLYFHTDRDLFECHEVLEAYWKQMPESQFNRSWVGLIQVAVGLYHHRRGNLVGAKKMLASAIANLEEVSLEQLGLDGKQFLQLIKARIQQVQEKPDEPYTDLDIPIRDSELLKICLERCNNKKLTWLQRSDLTNRQLIHKHTLRDRSEVIRERELQYSHRQQMRKMEGEGCGENSYSG